MQKVKASRDREWIDADSTGSYSSLTESWENRRKYHAILVVSRGQGFSRRVVLQNFLFDWKVFQPSVVAYDLDLTFKFRSFRVSLVMPKWKRVVILKILNENDLVIIPILNNRSIYDVNVRIDNVRVFENESFVRINDIELYFSFSNDRAILNREAPNKVEFFFDIDYMRGEECRDEGYILCSIQLPAGLNYIAIGPERVNNPDSLYELETKRRFDIYRRFGMYGLSTEKYIIKDSGIIAGYHWFSIWGRDSMISLPGLTFPFKRYDEAFRILKYFSLQVKDGMFPNCMDERSGEWSYNTVDGGLWFINRLYLYWKYSSDDKGGIELLPTAIDILDRVVHGRETYFLDGVLYHPSAWTWMDCVGPDGPYVDRRAAVEIQALLYSACHSLIEMSLELNYDIPEWISEIPKAMYLGFRKMFFENNIIKDSPQSLTIRPNAIYLLYFPYTLVSVEEFKETFEKIDLHLTTYFGLRTLDPKSENYRGKYLPFKDAAYHNGSVWPFLAGAATRAFLKIYGLSEKNRQTAYEKYLSGILDCLYVSGRCYGHIAEILDGDYPHEENGCIAQAWSLAEPLWAYYDLIISDPLVF